MRAMCLVHLILLNFISRIEAYKYGIFQAYVILPSLSTVSLNVQVLTSAFIFQMHSSDNYFYCFCFRLPNSTISNIS
jgi:hypothetical protein